MQCPVCKDIALVMTERQSIEIDYCPQCRGVCLDRGELDKIIERSEQQGAGRLPQEIGRIPPQNAVPAEQFGYKRHGEHRGHHHGRKSFWKEIFD